jgi:hypothetical protein
VSRHAPLAQDPFPSVGSAELLLEPWCTGYALIDQFWFDVEPSYIEGHRKKGVKHDRCEFGAGGGSPVDRSLRKLTPLDGVCMP